MELVEVKGYNIFCFTWKEYLLCEDALHGKVEASNALKGNTEDYFIFIEDRGILFYRFTAMYILYSSCNLSSLDILHTHFRSVNAIKLPDFGYKIRSTTSISTAALLTADTFCKDLFITLINRFLKYSSYLYVNPFSDNQKKIIYFEQSTMIIIKEKYPKYSEIFTKISSSKFSVACLTGKSGVFYILEDELIFAIPTVSGYFGSSYCVTRYYKCVPDSNGYYHLEEVQAENLSLIVDTVSLFKYDQAYIAESGKALLRGDNLFLSDLYPEVANVYRYDSRDGMTTSPTFLRDITDPNKIFTFCVGHYSVDSTDFTLSIILDCHNYMGQEKQGNLSERYLYPSNIMDKVYLWRIINQIVIEDVSYADQVVITPFYSNKVVHYVSSITDKKLLNLIAKGVSEKKFPVIYDVRRDCFYFLNYSNKGNTLICATYHENGCFALQGSSSYVSDVYFLKSRKIQWSPVSHYNSLNYMLSYSFMQYIRGACRSVEEVYSFDVEEGNEI